MVIHEQPVLQTPNQFQFCLIEFYEKDFDINFDMYTFKP